MSSESENTLRLLLPEVLGVTQIVPLMAALSQVRAARSSLELDCSRVRFVDPLGITALAAAIKGVLAQGQRVAMPWLGNNIASYLERMNFFVGLEVDAVNIPQNRTRHDQRGNLLEITHIVDSAQSEAVADQLAAAIVTKIIGRAQRPVNFHAPDTEYDHTWTLLGSSGCNIAPQSLWKVAPWASAIEGGTLRRAACPPSCSVT